MQKTCILFIFIISALTLSCTEKERPKEINLEKREAVEIIQKKPKEKSLRIAIGGMVTPREGYAYYRDLMDYIGERMGMHVELIDREDYAEVNMMIKAGQVDVAFVCGGPYVEGHDEFGMELLVAPQAYGETVYYSYIIVHKDSPIKTFEDLRGKSFAFTDPLSNSGKLVPTYMLAKMNETPESFFKKYIFTKAHDKSIKAVALRIVDGAAVDSLIWEYLNRTNPELTSKTRIILKSPPYGIPPVVVRPSLDPKIKKTLRDIFLNAHKDVKGKAILKKMMIDKFVLIDDSAYDTIREMKSFLEMQALRKERKI
jgi:phosphonate transport system substrate-binding protein